MEWKPSKLTNRIRGPANNRPVRHAVNRADAELADRYTRYMWRGMENIHEPKDQTGQDWWERGDQIKIAAPCRG